MHFSFIYVHEIFKIFIVLTLCFSALLHSQLVPCQSLLKILFVSIFSPYFLSHNSLYRNLKLFSRYLLLTEYCRSRTSRKFTLNNFDGNVKLQSLFNFWHFPIHSIQILKKFLHHQRCCLTFKIPHRQR